ncbi:DUF5064 family protein [Stutzerimonas nitrititolerans]|uniref:DUF5064 family protein n=1 Tax=Stutzerimonas nitrititolerans TaxID=2482751 RepID=UPI0028A71A85|nr:DUF5064 family protein [Stutzerimonas nitrititolerans]
MFKPGCLTRARLPGCHAQHRCIYDLQYQVRQDPDHGPMLQIQMRGEVDGKPFTEDFELYRDTAYNVFSRVARIAVRHGLRLRAGPILADRVECDAMYVDIRTRLGLQPGERVDLSHLQD